jgi:hypothetical protein
LVVGTDEAEREGRLAVVRRRWGKSTLICRQAPTIWGGYCEENESTSGGGKMKKYEEAESMHRRELEGHEKAMGNKHFYPAEDR